VTQAFPFTFYRRQRLNSLLPEFSMMGIGLVLLRALVPKALEWGLEEAEFSWVAESKHFSRGSLEKARAKLAKTYRVYDWDPEGDKNT
jgi:hypothetical protein